MRRILGSVTGADGARPTTDADAAEATIELCRALLSQRGEVSGTRLATELVTAYRALRPSALERFFDRLVEEWSPSVEEVARAAEAYRLDPSPEHLARLQSAIDSPRQELFRRVNVARGGIAVLIDLRRRLLRSLVDHPHRRSIDADLVHLFRSWFNRGFLVLERIDWRTSALVLERLIHYEAVHEIQGWRDLRRRLEADRRCYAFFHPALPEEPLIFIEVALTQELSAKVQPLLDPESPIADPASANCAIFYSITNCQEGLRGVSFGNFLIKQVVEDLGRELPRVKTFATLSPIPEFRRWLDTLAADPDHARLRANLGRLRSAAEGFDASPDHALGSDERQELTCLCAYYLLHAKQRKAPLDPVARFHLANGARLERLNWLGDVSATGVRRSFGLTANYVYRLDEVERNHEAYARDYRVVAARELERLARESLLSRRSASP